MEIVLNKMRLQFQAVTFGEWENLPDERRGVVISNSPFLIRLGNGTHIGVDENTTDKVGGFVELVAEQQSESMQPKFRVEERPREEVRIQKFRVEERPREEIRIDNLRVEEVPREEIRLSRVRNSKKAVNSKPVAARSSSR